jgi:Tfp pilus assembly protein FimT
MNNRKGLSDVVTTVLIILLVLAAVALIWGFLMPFFRGSGNQITSATSCLNLQMEVASCKNVSSGTNENYNITYRWTGGSDLTLDSAKVFIYDTDGSNKAVVAPKVDFLSSNTVNISASVKAGRTASVVGVIKNADGTTAACSESTKVTCIN